MRLTHWSLLSLLLLSAGVAGCFLPSAIPSDNPPNDGMISAQVEAKLKADRLDDLSGILVSTEAGTVTLVGSVRTPDQKARAAELARQVSGVKRVKNDLDIRGGLFE